MATVPKQRRKQSKMLDFFAEAAHREDVDAAPEVGEQNNTVNKENESQDTFPVSLENEDAPTFGALPPPTQNAQHCLSDEETKHLIEMNFQNSKTHNFFTCSAEHCTSLLEPECQRLKKMNKKFVHSWVLDKSNSWLCYVEGHGMYCVLCKKHLVSCQQNRGFCPEGAFVQTPSTRLKLDSIKSHRESDRHLRAFKSEKLQKMSIIHKDFVEQSTTKKTVLEKAFHTAYLIMKEGMANRKFLPLINFSQKIMGVSELRHFQHHSDGSIRSIFLAIGNEIKKQLASKLQNSNCFGLLIDEVTDIAVLSQLLTFVQYIDHNGCVQTDFLSVHSIMDSFESANANAIFTLVTEELEKNGLNVKNQLTGLATDGASVMTGKTNGVAAKMKDLCPLLISIHCMCHKLALACTDTSKELQYIKRVEETLTTLWKFFENSPKRLGMFFNVQLNVKKARMDQESNKTVLLHRLKKACSTRWLSFDQSVASVKAEYEPILLTLQQLVDDAVAIGLLKMLKSMKFLGTIYILSKVLPILSQLSKTFQQGASNFSQIEPQLQLAKQKITEIQQHDTALNELRHDLHTFSELSSELVLSTHQTEELENLQAKYIQTLLSNLEKRFPSCDKVSAFGIFDPLEVPPVDTPDFLNYGISSMEILSHHFYQSCKDQEGEARRKQLLAEWQALKYLVCNKIKAEMPKDIKEAKSSITPTQWFLNLLMRRRATYSNFFPEILWIAEMAATLPVSNAWPERGASALKLIKTRCRGQSRDWYKVNVFRYRNMGSR